VFFLYALPISAATLQVAAWIPYWREGSGVPEAVAHIGVFSELSPFGYRVKSDGTLVDSFGMTGDTAGQLLSVASSSKVKIIPSVMWSSSDAIQTVLKNPQKRKAHVAQIVSVVKANNFAGIDIDYEAKLATTRKYFSLFLMQLKKSLSNLPGKKILSCTIEPRTPPSSQFAVIPKGLEYANDYNAINAYCDEVRIMTYDQGTVDLILNKARTGPYAPIADPGWVEKVIRFAEQTISKKKIYIGLATYGYEYTVKQTSGGFTYERESAFDPDYAAGIAQMFNTAPSRNSAGELSLVYVPTSTPLAISGSNLKMTPSADTSSFGISPVTSANNISTTTAASLYRLLWWSDAQAIADKIAIAKKLGVKGVAIFKLDGGADPAIWNVLK